MIYRLKFVLAVFLLCCRLEPAHSKTIDVPTTVTNTEKYTQLNLNEEHSLELLQRWVEQAMSGLMGALATLKLEEVHEDDKEEHALCAKNATSVIEHAKCTVQLIDKEKRVTLPRVNSTKTTKRATTSFTTSTATPTEYSTMTAIRDSMIMTQKKMNELKPEKKSRLLSGNRSVQEYTDPENKDVSWVGSFGVRPKRSIDFEAFLAKLPDRKKSLKRRKASSKKLTTTTVEPRKVRKQASYSLRDAKKDTPFGALARAIKKSVLEAKHKTENGKDWITVIKEVKEETNKLKARKSLREMFKQKLATMQERYGNKTAINERRPLAMKDLDNLDEMSPKEMLDEAHRIEASLTGEQKIMREPLRLMRDAVKLGLMASGKDVNDFADKTLKLISPRMLPVFPEEENADDDQVSLLSPSLFALHNEGKGVEKATSLVDGLGLAKTKEHMAWLDLVMEASGVTDAVEYMKEEKIKKALNGGEGEIKSPTGQPFYFNKKNVSEILGEKETKKIDIFEVLHGTYTPEQIEEQKLRGFALLTQEQLEIVYGKNSPYANEERLETFKNISKEDVNGHIVNNIRALAEMESFKLRKKDLFLSPIILVPIIFLSVVVSGPVILSPLVLSPVILSPALLGPVILSPAIFVPVILSPRVLSPLIVNPIAFVPVILSPLALHPFILSPGIFNPFILSPFVLSPFILSPQAFSPAILSPFALSPFIGTPTVGSALVLSPFALSPIIMSPQIMFAAVLSPYVLSPLPWSPLIFAEVVASPSVLS